MKLAAQIFGWISVFAWGIWFGGLMYEMVVVLPLWSGDLPGSLTEWNSRPQFVINPTRFFAPVAIATVLSSLLALIFGGGNGRLWRTVSFAFATLTLAFTLIYFFPKNEVIFRNQYIGLSGEEISWVAASWITANWFRVVLMIIGFWGALRAFKTTPSE